MTELSQQTEIIESAEKSYNDFVRARELGKRGARIVLHPYTREHIDVVDFDEEIAARKAAGLEGYGFWSTPIPKEVEK